MRGFAPGRHCVTAFCGLRPLVLQGEVSPCEPLWPASQLILAEKNRQRPRIVRYILYHDPCPASRRAWLPDFFIGGLARMGREKPQQPESFLAACGRKNFLGFGFWVLGFARAARPIKPCRRSR